MTVVKPLFIEKEALSPSRPATGPANPKVLTQTRKHVNALLSQDYDHICKQLEEAVKTVQQLVAAKTDLELLAQISNVQLDPPNE
jgi:hypothetical protein